MTRTLDQAVGGSGAAASPSASTTLATTDFDRPLFPTGAITLTMPNGGAGWRTGRIINANTAFGIVTLAAPAGATLDGVASGTQAVLPGQSLSVIQTGATSYVTAWIERSPIVARGDVTTAAATVDIPLPDGYVEFEIRVTDVVVASGASVLMRLSGDGTNFASGAADYARAYTIINGSNNTTANYTGSASSILIAPFLNTNSGQYCPIIEAILTPGSAASMPGIVNRAMTRNGDPSWVSFQGGGFYGGTSFGGRAVKARIFADTGNIALKYRVRGIQ